MTLLATVVSVDAERKQSLVQVPDGSQAWIAGDEDTLLSVSRDLSAFTETEA